jgi:predicted alpha/beta-fold hydrolase
MGARLLRSRRGVRLARERLELPDGDFVDLDWAAEEVPESSETTQPLALVLHGLEGSARSKYALQAYRELTAREVSAVGLNFRGCSGEPNRLPRMYHSGETGDLAWVLAELRHRFPHRPIGVVGFSLGGNVLLKYLGEHGSRSSHAGVGSPPAAPVGEATGNLSAAAAVSVPFDLAASADGIERGGSRLYLQYLMRRLRRKVRAKASLLRAHLDVGDLLAARTFWEFDGRGTAPLHGFADAADYYRRSSSGPLLDRIAVPTLVVHSRDDPFLPAAAIPESAIRANSWIEARITEHGGHVGFVAGPPWAPRFWAEETAAEFLARRLATVA